MADCGKPGKGGVVATGVPLTAHWTPLVVAPASEVHELQSGHPDQLRAYGTFTIYSAVSDGRGSIWLAVGPHLLFELQPGDPVLKVGERTFMFRAPGGGEGRYLRAVLGTGTTPDVLSALESVLNEATQFQAASTPNSAAQARAESSAAAAAQARVDADEHSRRSAAPPGQRCSMDGNPFADAAPGPDHEAAGGSGSGGGGNPFAQGAAPSAPMQSAEYDIKAEMWTRPQPASAPAAPAAYPSPYPAPTAPPARAPAPCPTPAARAPAPAPAPYPTPAAPAPGPPPTFVPSGPPPSRRTGGAAPAAAAAAAAAGGSAGAPMGAPPSAAGTAAGASGTGAAAQPPPQRQGSYSSKKAIKIEGYANRLASSVSGVMARSASGGPPPPPAPEGYTTAMKLRLAATKNLGWAAAKASGALAAGSSWAGAKMAAAVDSPVHPKRKEIASASGLGLKKVFESMEALGRQASQQAALAEDVARRAAGEAQPGGVSTGVPVGSAAPPPARPAT